MKQWTKIGIALGALVLAIAAGTSAYAMRGGDDDGGDSATRDSQNDEKRIADPSQADGGAGPVAAVCAEGHPDCQDTIVGDAMDQPCSEDGCTGESSDADCPPDMACIEPWLMDPPVCPDGVEPAVCFPDGQPYKCVTLETYPPQTRCFAAGCGVPVELPVPGEPPIEEAPAPGETTIDATVGPLVDPMPDDIAVAEDEKIREQAARAGEEILPCTPPEDCTSSNLEGARCLPPDCAVSSDGGIVACPDERVDPPADGEGGSEPGNPGPDGGIDPETQIDPPAPSAE